MKKLLIVVAMVAIGGCAGPRYGTSAGGMEQAGSSGMQTGTSHWDNNSGDQGAPHSIGF